MTEPIEETKQSEMINVLDYNDFLDIIPKDISEAKQKLKTNQHLREFVAYSNILNSKVLFLEHRLKNNNQSLTRKEYASYSENMIKQFPIFCYYGAKINDEEFDFKTETQKAFEWCVDILTNDGQEQPSDSIEYLKQLKFLSDHLVFKKYNVNYINTIKTYNETNAYKYCFIYIVGNFIVSNKTILSI